MRKNRFLICICIIVTLIISTFNNTVSAFKDGGAYIDDDEEGWEDFDNSDDFGDLFNDADYSKASLNQNQFIYTLYEQNYSGKDFGFSGELYFINSIHPESLTEKDYSYVQTKSDLKIEYLSIYDDEIFFAAYGHGTTTVTLTVKGTQFKFNVTGNIAKLKGDTSILLKKGKKKQLSATGINDKITWKSSNTKVATVTSKGKVKAKKEGNVVITASTNEGKLGCVVSVVSSKRYKVIKEAIKIGKKYKYSQKKRMKKGYYDCSSAVWKAYKKAKIYFGDKHYAPTAANNAKWCVKNGKKVKGKIPKSVTKMKYLPGDLFYSTGTDKGRYKGIGHVEMLAGYRFYGFDAKGKAVVGPIWAIDNGYTGKNGLVADPFKKK